MGVAKFGWRTSVLACTAVASDEASVKPANLHAACLGPEVALTQQSVRSKQSLHVENLSVDTMLVTCLGVT